MSKATFTKLIVLCAALAACSDANTSRTVTAPEVGPSLSEAPADLGVAYTVDGPSELAEATEAASTQMAAAAQAASGGRSSGHVGLNFPSSRGIVSENYSFVALSTDPFTPLAAKGQYELMLTTASGRTNKVHGDVICMGISGNTARIAGQITKLFINNVQVPISGRTHNVWVVQDNGEGQGPPDLVSLMGFTFAPGAAFHCATGLPSVVFPNQEGNVQVQP